MSGDLSHFYETIRTKAMSIEEARALEKKIREAGGNMRAVQTLGGVLWVTDDDWLEKISKQINTDMNTQETPKEAQRMRPSDVGAASLEATLKQEPTVKLGFDDLEPCMKEHMFLLDEIERNLEFICETTFGFPRFVGSDKTEDSRGYLIGDIYHHNINVLNRLRDVQSTLLKMVEKLPSKGDKQRG